MIKKTLPSKNNAIFVNTSCNGKVIGYRTTFVVMHKQKPKPMARLDNNCLGAIGKDVPSMVTLQRTAKAFYRKGETMYHVICTACGTSFPSNLDAEDMNMEDYPCPTCGSISCFIEDVDAFENEDQ